MQYIYYIWIIFNGIIKKTNTRRFEQRTGLKYKYEVVMLGKILFDELEERYVNFLQEKENSGLIKAHLLRGLYQSLPIFRQSFSYSKFKEVRVAKYT